MPSRNDLCPCGSGRKYKRCCMSADLAVPSALRLVRAAGGSDPRGLDLRARDVGLRWEVDMLPAAVTIDDSPDGRPAVAMVAAGDLVLHADVIARSPSEPDAIATLLLDALARARAATGRNPVSLLVRHDALAVPIEAGLAALASPKPLVSVARALPAVDNAMEHLERTIFGLPPNRGVPRVSRPATWAAWGVPPHLVAALFNAAADFFRFAPWDILANEDVLTIGVSGGRTWSVVVMGQAREAYGLALYESADDFRDLLDSDDDSPERALQWTRGIVLSLLFENRDELPPRALREVRANHWPVAGPSAYPTVIPMHTPGGGLSEAHLTDLITILDVVPRFLAAHRDPYGERASAGAALRWTDDTWKAVVLYDGPWIGGADMIWVVPTVLSPCTPQGPGSQPEAVYPLGADLDAEVETEHQLVADFEWWLQRPGVAGRVSAATARRHARVAELFVEYMVFTAGSPVAAVNELDLRIFVYETYPLRYRETEPQARAMLGSLERFLAYLADAKGIETPWRDSIIDDREAFYRRWETSPDHLASEAEVMPWITELLADLDQRVLLLDAPEAMDELELAALTDSATLDDEHAVRQLARRWLLWRDEAIRAGVTAPAEVKEYVMERYAR